MYINDNLFSAFVYFLIVVNVCICHLLFPTTPSTKNQNQKNPTLTPNQTFQRMPCQPLQKLQK